MRVQLLRPVDVAAAPLLERESSLALLNEYAAQAADGEGRLVLLGGEAGVGKSALVERLHWDLPDARWSWSMCDGLFTPRPLGPLFDLADQFGGTLLERCRAGADREDLFRALLGQVSASEVLDVVVVEDIHWADEATLDLLRYLSRRLRDAAVLLIATYRDDGLAAADPLRVALGDLASQRCTRRIGLMPLSPDAVRRLAGGSGPPAPDLYRLTGGNPFYVTEVLRAGMEEVPPSARDAVLARAARLSGDAREVLDVAALTGSRVEARLLESVTGCPPSVLDELLEAERYLVSALAYCDEHDIATYAICLRGEQSSMLEQTGRWDEAIALSTEILIEVGPSPANRLCALIRLGTMRARRGEPGVWECLDEAAATADETGEPQQQVSARLARAEAHWLEGRPDAARHEAELAGDACDTPSAWLRGAVAAWLRRTGSPRPARAQVAEPYELLLDGDPLAAARVWARLGCPYDAALALADVPDEEALREALGLVIGLGAQPAARIIRQRLRMLGARSIPAGPHAATRKRPFGLTRRECEVLDLICAEHSNAEIAAKLFISAKTVDHHVSAVLAKLGVPTRGAARRAARLRLAGAEE